MIKYKTCKTCNCTQCRYPSKYRTYVHRAGNKKFRQGANSYLSQHRYDLAKLDSFTNIVLGCGYVM